jgi:hypothetical protein
LLQNTFCWNLGLHCLYISKLIILATRSPTSSPVGIT